MTKHLFVAAAAILAATTGQAWANCNYTPAIACLERVGSDPNLYLPRLQPGVGGQIVCAAQTPPSNVQYDIYTWHNKYVYACTMTQTCAWAQTNDPQAEALFCP